jgi:hypothetical protein
VNLGRDGLRGDEDFRDVVGLTAQWFCASDLTGIPSRHIL